MRESRTYGSVRGVLSNGHPYRDSLAALPAQAGTHVSADRLVRLSAGGRPGTTAPLTSRLYAGDVALVSAVSTTAKLNRG